MSNYSQPNRATDDQHTLLYKAAMAQYLLQQQNAQALAEGSLVNPAADGTYTIGIGGTQNGQITVQNGIITAITEAEP
jgi:hypothetical protein